MRPKAYLGDGKYIFVSYSHKDSDEVYKFINILQTKYNVWFDEGIHFGREWDEEIVDKIDKCSLFIYVITENSLNSKNCKDEIAFAKQNDIPFINVLMDDMELPSIFTFRYGRFQMLKYFEYIDKSEVLNDLERRSDEIKLTETKNKSKVKAPKASKQSEIVRHNNNATNVNTQDYALFTFEKEVTLFSVFDADKELTIKKKEYFDDNGDRLYRLVMLPGESMNTPVQKVEVNEVGLFDENEKRIALFNSDKGIDAKYAHDVLNRGYNCISINFKTDKDILYLFNKVKFLRLKTKIYSIFGTCLDVDFDVVIKDKTNIEHNPDVKDIPDLVSFNIHHCHYKVNR